MIKQIVVSSVALCTNSKRFAVYIVWTVFFSFLSFTHISGQQAFRRHFIIAYDVSTPFINAERSCPAYRQALIALFSNENVDKFNEAYQNNLQVEKQNGLLFFDNQRDEISFFHFNIAASEFNALQRSVFTNNENEIVSKFNNSFLKNKNFYWTTAFYDDRDADVADYLKNVLSIRPTPASFGLGVSMSNFVYPLILDKIDTTKFAEEYILIILSDFLTGSMLGNTQDLNRVRDIYGPYPYHAPLPTEHPTSYIKKQIDFLASQYYKIDFFHYSFIPSATNAIGIISYKIKPKIGVLTPEDVSLFVDGDLNLNQRGYQNQEFQLSKTKIKFTHNHNLIPIELRLTIVLSEGKTIFDGIIAQKDNAGNWNSLYTSDKNLMNFDQSALTYYLPRFKITVEPIINQKDFENLKFIYEFKSKYEIANLQPLNFIYKTERAVSIDNIIYSTKASIIIMYYLSPVLVVLFIFVILVMYGKPRTLRFHLDGYLDSFEKIDYKTDGRLLTPFKAWNYEMQKEDLLLVNGYLQFKSGNFPFNWNSPVYLRLIVEKSPNGFELFLKRNINDIKEFGVGMPATIKKGRKGTLSFIVGIRQTDITKHINTPELVKFSIESFIEDSIVFIKSELRESVNYKFHIGPDLGDVWVGFDPGTTGSCVALGSASENILLSEGGAQDKIIPSAIVFDKTAKNTPSDDTDIPEDIYTHGEKAEALFKTKTRFVGFKSIKKLLGFKDIKRITFDNDHILEMKGKDLASLLVKGLFKDVNSYFNRPDFNADDYKRDGQFNPLRAVVAIPNNFTTAKIQDMVDCIASLNQFKEIRYVYEAEAALFYYLSNYSHSNIDSETVLVFDMGGATINATIVNVNKISVNNQSKYEIDFLSKIGYGIGGDTIDYCISKFLLSWAKEFPALESIDILEKKNELASLSLNIKKEIISNYYSDKEHLITAYNLQTFINRTLDISITISEYESELYKKYFLKSVNGSFGIFEHPLFSKFIYNNVKDAVREARELSGNVSIDKIIFSGRSTAFPMIKETVNKQLNVKENACIALGLEESKTAVAKGACWYGINKNSVWLNNIKTKASFGFKQTQSANMASAKFFELINMGNVFDETIEDVKIVEDYKEIVSDFAFDGNKVNFYQIMGKDADMILSEEQKHKFSKIATIRLDQMTSVIAMRVNENDEVDCRVRLQSNRILGTKGVVADQEIGEANEEHYTWMVQ